MKNGSIFDVSFVYGGGCTPVEYCKYSPAGDVRVPSFNTGKVFHSFFCEIITGWEGLLMSKGYCCSLTPETGK